MSCRVPSAAPTGTSPLPYQVSMASIAGAEARLLTSETAPRYLTSPLSAAALTRAKAVTSSHHSAMSLSTMTRGTACGALATAGGPGATSRSEVERAASRPARVSRMPGHSIHVFRSTLGTIAPHGAQDPSAHAPARRDAGRAGRLRRQLRRQLQLDRQRPHGEAFAAAGQVPEGREGRARPPARLGRLLPAVAARRARAGEGAEHRPPGLRRP